VAQEGDKLSQEIRKLISHETEISHDQIPGFIIGIIDHDSTFSRSFGSRVKDKAVPISDTSLFEIGGLSKVFTAHLVLLLSQKSILDLDRSLNKYLPNEYVNINYDGVTIRDLLCHNSGLPYLPNDMGKHQGGPGPYANYRKSYVLEFFSKLSAPSNHPRYLYSNLNYALLEIIIEHQTGSSFAQVFKENLSHPLNLSNTFVEGEHKYAMAPGYDRAGRITKVWAFQSFAGSEGIKTNLRDLQRYMQYLLTTSEGENILNHLLTAEIPIRNSKRAFTAMGWHFFKSKKSNLYLHSGKTDGHAASIHFIPGTKTAVIILANSPGKMDGLATLILRMINHNWKRKS